MPSEHFTANEFFQLMQEVQAATNRLNLALLRFDAKRRRLLETSQDRLKEAGLLLSSAKRSRKNV